MSNENQPNFFVKVIVVVVAVIIVMFLAKAWFFTGDSGKRSYSSNSPKSSPTAINTSDAGSVISWKDANDYIGQTMTVEGTIVATYNSGKACFLNFHKDYKKYFTAVIFASDFHSFPDSPQNYYLDKKVRVSGLIKEYQGKSEIILNSLSQIEIVE